MSEKIFDSLTEIFGMISFLDKHPVLKDSFDTIVVSLRTLEKKLEEEDGNEYFKEHISIFLDLVRTYLKEYKEVVNEKKHPSFNHIHENLVRRITILMQSYLLEMDVEEFKELAFSSDKWYNNEE